MSLRHMQTLRIRGEFILSYMMVHLPKKCPHPESLELVSRISYMAFEMEDGPSAPNITSRLARGRHEHPT